MTSVQLLKHCLEELLLEISSQSAHSPFELKLSLSGFKWIRFGDSERMYRIALKYPGNGNFYIALNSRLFSKFVCGWIGAVRESYILSIDSLKQKLVPISSAVTVSMIFDSDEDVDPLRCETSILEQDFTNCDTVAPTGLSIDESANLDDGDIV